MTIGCPDCGTLVEMPHPDTGGTTSCPTCEHTLERSSGRSVLAALACASATFALLWPANLLPLMSVSMMGMHTESRISSSIAALWDGHWVVLAVLVCSFVMVFPIVRFGLLTVVLGCLQFDKRPRWLGRAFRWCLRLDHWAMPDVFLVGCLVGYSRVVAFLPTTIEAGGWCVATAAIMCMITRASLDKRTVWRDIAPNRPCPPDGQPVISCAVCDLILPASEEGTHCPRCAMRISARKPHAMVRTAAFTIAGLILYLPAYFYPMNVDIQLGELNQHRIIDGIQQLIGAHLWPLAVLIFFTSIAIPALKLLGMTWLMFSVRRRSRKYLVFKSHLYRIIDEIGRWSSVDVFTVAVFLPVIQFGGLARTEAAVGSLAFMLVVVCTMIASRDFDMRLVWDAAQEAQPTPNATSPPSLSQQPGFSS